MSLKDQITEDMKTAMRARDRERLGAIRLLLAAAKQKEVDERVVLDPEVISTRGTLSAIRDKAKASLLAQK